VDARFDISDAEVKSERLVMKPSVIGRGEESESVFEIFAGDEKVGKFTIHGGWMDRHEIFKNIPNAELGCYIDEPYWGRGYATEATRACMDFLADSLGIELFSIAHTPKNRASRKVAEKLGFTLYEVSQFYSKTRGRFVDDVRHIWGLTY